MKKYLLLLLVFVGAYNFSYAQYKRSKAETIDFINRTLKLREETNVFESEPVSNSSYLILLQELNDETFKQTKQAADNKRLTTVVTKIQWNAFRAFGYNDNRSELYIYFNKKVMVNNIPAEAFSIYIPADKLESIKNAILRLVQIIKEEK
jgi:hypothetical protein